MTPGVPSEGVIGQGVSVYFSQIFFKAPEGGGPKPPHQDNFYFGPRDPEALSRRGSRLTTPPWRTAACISAKARIARRSPAYRAGRRAVQPAGAGGRHRGVADDAAPVPKGGVSFHHGGVLHQSGPNLSQRWRRACALHYVRNDNAFVYARAALRRNDVPEDHMNDTGYDTARRYALAIAAHVALVPPGTCSSSSATCRSSSCPRPSATLDALLQPNYNWWANILVTGTEIFAGYFLALVVGIALALVFTWSNRSNRSSCRCSCRST